GEVADGAGGTDRLSPAELDELLAGVAARAGEVAEAIARGGARGSARDLRLGRPLPVPGSVPVRVVTAPEQSALFEDPGGAAERLTPEQARAVDARAGSRLLHANAGSGKTTVVVERFARAVVDDG